MGKRLSVIVAAGILIMTMAACGANKEDSSGGDGNSGKVYKFATDAAYAPMEYMDKDKITGFDADFLKAVMDEAGLKYTITNTGWDSMLTEVQSGSTYDAGISSVSITPEREESYDYSIPYFESTNMIMVKEDSTIASAADLKGKKVAVQGSTTADTLMSGIMGSDNTDLKRFDSNAVAMLELDSGGVDAVVADIAIVREYMKNNPERKLKGILDTASFGSEFYGILLPTGSELKAKLDPAIKKVLENGKYTEIYKQWFGEEPNVDNVLNAK
ncbi:basic amino acid ABC transporter substrate-binding protein [Paenibacillus glycanilyticus]|uniref:Basic amino acid ABC transporter substrate-binding protein n=1 Tax=Paenibacillus glycanilyticus TaxID=126569 RepID=A0ABQ6GE60_9BACL|nr:basic amino acid ABC transporter substrate-binding protein [Paenibacillus glycanilyticus]GLX67342.1 basic amino acid ABC transporter substrate-binding protein [Paenibacillus glycanilyticus]